MDVRDIGTHPQELVDGDVARPLGRVRPDASGQLEAEDPPAGLIEIDVVDLPLLVAELGEHARPEQGLLASDDGPDLGHVVRRDHALASRDDDRITAKAGDFLDRDDQRVPEQAAFVGKQTDDRVVVGAQDDVLDVVQMRAVCQAQDRLPDHALSLAHHGLLEDRCEEVQEGNHRHDDQHRQ